MLITVEGCIGAGKTTVVKGLAAHRRSNTLLEAFETNPFLSAFYKDPAKNALETEFAFLLLHYHQLKSNTALITSEELICDFHLGKDLLYANLNLKEPEAHRLFAELYRFLVDKTQIPSLLIYLSATNDLILERVRERNREFELAINESYYCHVNEHYEVLFKDFPGKKIEVRMEEWNFIRNPRLFDDLSQLVDLELSK